MRVLPQFRSSPTSPLAEGSPRGRPHRRGKRPLAVQRSCPLRLEQLEDRNLLAPTVLDPNLMVQPVISNLNTPINMAFLGDDDFFVLEKNTGRVRHVVNGV